MRILWVKMGGLWPSTTGGRVRSLHTISELSRRHQVTVVTTHGIGDDPEGLARQLSNCDRVVSLPYAVPKRGSSAFPAAVVRSWFSRYPVDLWKWQVPGVRAQVQTFMDAGVDLVVADFLFASMNVPTTGSTPVVLFEHNVEYQIWRRLAKLERRPWIRTILEVEWRKLRAREADACRRADLTIAVSADDRRRLEQLAPGIAAVSIPTGVDTDYFTPMPGSERPAHLVFSGSMDWHPNEDAVLYFLDAVLPSIRAQIPETTFTVVGRNPSARLRDAAGRVGGVTVTGTVSDVRPSIAEGSVYVVPLRAGGGTRLKIFEALAMARPVVSTTVGAEGLGIGPGRHYTCADEPGAFANAVVALLHDPHRRAELGAAGRHLVETCYSWPTIGRVFEQRCEEVVAEHGYSHRSADRRAHQSRGGTPRSRRARVVAGEHNEIGWSAHHP
ncbi:MAG TPA: glycosyltransferase family 4 protein [Vicinamibacterales bacterium]|nr:glycosyltransferase family 4 protein [Vicinamibacterales bacterium]